MSIINTMPPDALAEAWQIIEKRRKEEMSKKLGRQIGTWGGEREGGFGKKSKPYNTVIKLQLNSVQQKILTEMGDGNIAQGIEKLINENM